MSELLQLPYVEQNKTRAGSVRYYFRRRLTGRIRLPDPASDPALFRRIYDRCISDARAIQPRLPSRKVSATTKPTPKLKRKKKHNPIYRAIWLAKARAKLKKRRFNLTAGWLLARLEDQDYCCAATGIRMAAFNDPGYATSPFRPSIDRIDNAGGYTQGNCRVVILALNLAMNQWGLETTVEIARRLISRTDCHPHAVLPRHTLAKCEPNQ